MFYLQTKRLLHAGHLIVAIGLVLCGIGQPALAQNGREIICKTGDFALAAHLEEGAFLRGQREYVEALPHYICAIEIAPELPEAYAGRSLIYMAQGNYEAALGDLTAALAFAPEDASLHNNHGWALHKLQRYDDALKSFGRAIELDAEYAIAFNNRGVVHRTLEMTDEAIDDYKAAASYRHPVPHAPYMNLGTLYLNDLAAPEDAIYWYKEATRISPREAILYKLLGDIYRDTGNLAAAEEAYWEYVQLENDASEEVLAYLRQHDFTRIYLPLFIVASLLSIAVGYLVWQTWQKRQKQDAIEHAPFKPVMLGRLVNQPEFNSGYIAKAHPEQNEADNK